jgi:hypothetical protein
VCDAPTDGIAFAVAAAGLAAAIAEVEIRESEDSIRAFEESAVMRAQWRAQQDRSVRPEWDITDPDLLRKVWFLLK